MSRRSASASDSRHTAAPVRVALVSDAFFPESGGLSLQLRDLALALRAAGFDPHIVTAKGAKDAELPVHIVRSTFAFGRGTALSTMLRSEAIDVVHAHAFGLSPLSFAAAMAAARAGLPSVLTFQSMLDRTSALLGASDALLGWTRDIVLTAVSSVVAAQAARAIAGASVGVLSSGIDARFWSGVSHRVASREMHFVGSLESAGDGSAFALVRAFATAVRFVAGSPEMRLTIAGDRPDAQRIGRLAAELGVGARVKLAGSLSRLEQRALYADADVFVLPGAREAFGLAALEARASGLPIVAMLSSGARDYVTPGMHGLLARDETEMARFMSRLAVEDPLRRFIGNHNRRDMPPYDWPLVVQLHRKIYDAAAALRDAPAPASHR
jgi:glycosyltransferase involved in cell wall biosynthesis